MSTPFATVAIAVAGTDVSVSTARAAFPFSVLSVIEAVTTLTIDTEVSGGCVLPNAREAAD